MTPTGSRRIMLVQPLAYSPAALPSTTRAAPAKKRRLSMLNSRSKSATPLGLPTFSDSSFDSSAAWSSIAWAHFQSIMLRSPGVVCDHSSNAVRAASTALSTSATVPLGTCPIVSSVAGLMTGMVSEVEASAQSPLINMRRLGVAVSVMSPDPLCDERGDVLGCANPSRAAVDDKPAARRRHSSMCRSPGYARTDLTMHDDVFPPEHEHIFMNMSRPVVVNIEAIVRWAAG